MLVDLLVGDTVGGYGEPDVLEVVGSGAVVGQELVDLEASCLGSPREAADDQDEDEYGHDAAEELLFFIAGSHPALLEVLLVGRRGID